MKRPEWFERKFEFGLSPAMLPFFLERLEGVIPRIERKVIDLADNALSWQPGGKWSIKQHIGHLAEVDKIANRRIDEMLNGISPLSPAVFEPRQDYNRQSVAEVIDYFIKNRVQNLNRYNALSDEDCLKSSLHPRLNIMMNPVDLAFFDAEHDDHHLVKIGEIRSLVTTHYRSSVDN